MRLSIFLLTCLALCCAQAPTADKPIPAELQVEYFRTAALVAQQNIALRDAIDQNKLAVESLQRFCGGEAQPNIEGKIFVCRAKVKIPMPDVLPTQGIGRTP
jgi:hypothetical protein